MPAAAPLFILLSFSDPAPNPRCSSLHPFSQVTRYSSPGATQGPKTGLHRIHAASGRPVRSKLITQQDKTSQTSSCSSKTCPVTGPHPLPTKGASPPVSPMRGCVRAQRQRVPVSLRACRDTYLLQVLYGSQVLPVRTASSSSDGDCPWNSRSGRSSESASTMGLAGHRPSGLCRV